MQVSLEIQLEVLKQLRLMKYALIAPYTIVLWDFLLLFGREVEYVYLTDRWTSLKCIYLLCRCLPIALWPYIMWCYMVDHTQEECTEKVIVLQHIIFMLLQFLPHCVLALRAYAYTGQKRRIRLLLTFLLTFYLGTQLWGYFSEAGRQLEIHMFEWFGRSSCFRDCAQGRRRFGYVVIVGTIVDCVSTVLVIKRSVRLFGMDGDLQRVFLRQGLSLFAFMLCINVLSLISLLQTQVQSWEGFCFTFVMLLPNSLACRFILELREVTASKTRQDAILSDFGRIIDEYFARRESDLAIEMSDILHDDS